ncbi:MAG: glycine cleavage system aminomethyltransferase GcvT [Acidobacteria bacterium]|nr:glycine cleavage system aminomethyltransferase GcvT [Acidobacteriota bacterium]
MSDDPKRTPLNQWHRDHGAKMVDFGGWDMPIQFEGILAEHKAVRQRAGLFDVSHMGEVRIRGDDALAFIQHLTTNDAGGLELGQAQYTLMTNHAGGVIDDLLVYRLAETDYLLVINAATTPKDVAWIEEQAEDFGGLLEVRDESDEWAQLALQGPDAETILSRIVALDLASIGYYRAAFTDIDGVQALVSRTGYTGEDGFEVYLPPSQAADFADTILDAGANEGVVPVGLGARDTLRLEAGMLLYGNDMDESRSPVEANLRWLTKPGKGEFIGKDAIVAQIEAGTAERLVGFELIDRGVPRHGYELYGADEQAIGEVTSGSFSPTLQKGIGLGYVPAEHTEVGGLLKVDIRGRKLEVRVVKTPFYRRPQPS